MKLLPTIGALFIVILLLSGFPCQGSAADGDDPAQAISSGETIVFEKTEEIPFRYAIAIPAGLNKNEQIYIQFQPELGNTSGKLYGKSRALELRTISLNVDFIFKAGEVGDEALSAPGAFFIKDFYWEEGEQFDSMFYRNETYRQPHKIFEKIIDQAVGYLTAKGFIVDRRVLIDGFSTDGFFAQHFAVMSPAYVRAIVAGQCAGVLMLPFEEIDGVALRYPLGIADYEQSYIDGTAWDKEAYQAIDQLIYIADVDQVCDGIWDMMRFEENIKFIVNRFGVLVPERLYREVKYMQENGFDKIQFLLAQGNMENPHFPLPSSVRYQFLLDAVNGTLAENVDGYNTPEDEVFGRLASVTVEATGWQKELRDYLTGLLD